MGEKSSPPLLLVEEVDKPLCKKINSVIIYDKADLGSRPTTVITRGD